ncbi:MAG: ABC transporter substrate-binding protein, partial [Rhizobium giardinii]
MKNSCDFRRLRSWELALAVFAVSAPFALPVASPPSFVRAAVAQDMQKIDTSRMVSVGGAITEIIYALGEEGKLVGRDSTSVYPEAASKLPNVGYMRQLAPEGVIATNPSAIIAVEGSGPPETLNVLKEAKIPFQTVPEKFDRDGILEKIKIVGDFLGVPERAAALSEKVNADLDAAVADAAKRPEAERKRVMFILSTQGGKIMASGTGTAADGIIALAGAVNATASFPG